MDDLISRQAAIETVMECYDNDELFEVYEDKLRELPPAQSEPSQVAKDIARIVENEQDMMVIAQPTIHPKKGKWVDEGDPLMLTCGNCGYAVMRYNNTPFCPNCGAKMEVTE